MPYLLRALLLFPVCLSAQLPTLAVDPGRIRFEVGGAFQPVNAIWLNGQRGELGSLLTGPLDASHSGLVAGTEQMLSRVSGLGLNGQSLGSFTTTAQWQRNTGLISAAVGVASKWTVFTTIPIISTRTERLTHFDPADATLGINPAGPLGVGGGQTQQYLARLAASLDELDQRIESGELGGLGEEAREWLRRGRELHLGLGSTFGAQGLPLLPLADSPFAAALLSELDEFGNELSSRYGVTPPGAALAFPATVITPGQIDLLGARSSGFEQPLTSLGRIELGTWYEILSRGDGNTASAGWVGGLVRLGTGREPDPTLPLDQGSGGKGHEIEVGATMDLRQQRRGIRLSAALTQPLPLTLKGTAAVAGDMLPDQLAGPSLTLRRQGGSAASLSAQPWLGLAPGFSLTGLAALDHRGTDRYTILEVDSRGLEPNGLGSNSGGTALRLGAGISYMQDGRHHDGSIGFPQEAGLSLERTIIGRGGLVADYLTTRVYFRFYM